jgi:hypothetical protein
MTTITIDLREILEAKLQHGFHVPVSIDASDFLDYADDDWDEPIDLDCYLAQRQEAAVVFSAKDVKRLRPHLSDDQAWEVVEITRDQTQSMMDDFLSDVADEACPSGKRLLQSRLVRLKLRVTDQHKLNPEAERILQELAGIQRLLGKVPDDTKGNPALEGSIAATLDDLEQIVEGWSTTNTQEG